MLWFAKGIGMDNRYLRVAACFSLAVGSLWAANEWTQTKLNDYAVKDDGGNIVVLGTEGSYNDNAARTKAAVFDGDTSTFFDPPSSVVSDTQCWAGFELTEPMVVTRIRYYGRADSNYARMYDCLFQGANEADFSDAVTLFIASADDGWGTTHNWADVLVANPDSLKSYKYLRILSPNFVGQSSTGNCCGNAGEVEFYGITPAKLSSTFDGKSPDFPASYLKSKHFINYTFNIGVAYTSRVPFYEVQRKPTSGGDDSWEVAGYIPFTWDGYTKTTDTGYQFVDTKPVYESTDYRIRAYGTVTQSSWFDIGTFAPKYVAVGNWIGIQGAYDSTSTGAKAFDGLFSTYFDPPSGPNKGGWIGLDLGKTITIAGIRASCRANWAGRLNTCEVQIADEVTEDPTGHADCEFVNPVTVATISGAVQTETYELVFNEPVQARYIRIKAPSDLVFNISELEIDLTPAPQFAPELSVTMSDLDNEYAVLSWASLDTNTVKRTATVVYRSNNTNGPWTCLADDLPADATTYTDDTLLVGPRYYYAIAYRNTVGETDYDGSMSELVRYRRGRRLDRDPDDETTLLPGFTVIKNGTMWPNDESGTGYATKAFDGNLDTFPDMNEGSALLGLDMGGLYGLTAVEAYPRSGWASRLNGAVAYGSNDTTDWAAGAEAISTSISCSSITWSTAVGTSDNEYRYLLLGKNANNNVAELRFYGWSHEDAMQVLAAPENITLTPTADGTVVAWEECGQASSYQVQRQVNDGSWTIAANGLTAPTFTDSDVTYDGTRYAYRIVVSDAEGNIVISEDVSSIPYLPGNGTGLYGVYYKNYSRSYNPDEEICGERIDSQLDFDWAAGGPYSGITNNFSALWTGKIIIPFNGTYSFTAEFDDGIRLIIDDTIVLNDWDNVGAEYATTGTATLTAGEHSIRIDYNENTGNASCKLYWGGCLNTEIIPSSQLIPEKVAVDPVQSPWIGTRSLEGHFLGLTTFNEDGSISISHGGLDTYSSEESFRYLWQEISGPFVCSMKIDFSESNENSSNTRGMLMLRNALAKGEPMFLTIAERYQKTTYRWNGKVRPGLLSNGVAIKDNFGWNNTCAQTCWIQVKRVRSEFTVSVKTEENADWSVLYTYSDTDGVFNNTLLVGPATGSAGKQPLSAVKYSDFQLVKYSEGTMIILQ